jgi:hypothetical protein
MVYYYKEYYENYKKVRKEDWQLPSSVFLANPQKHQPTFELCIKSRVNL